MPKQQIFDRWKTIEEWETVGGSGIESCRCDMRYCIKNTINFGRVEISDDSEVRHIPEDIRKCKQFGQHMKRTLKFNTGETVTYLPNWQGMLPDDDSPERCSCDDRECIIEAGTGVRRNLHSWEELHGSVASCETYRKYVLSLSLNQLKEFLSRVFVSIPDDEEVMA
jgi:hypothetical protein